MIKRCEVLIRTGEGKFIPVGTAEVSIDLGYSDYSRDKEAKSATLNKLDINVKEKDILWEHPDGCNSSYY